MHLLSSAKCTEQTRKIKDGFQLIEVIYFFFFLLFYILGTPE